MGCGAVEIPGERIVVGIGRRCREVGVGILCHRDRIWINRRSNGGSFIHVADVDRHRRRGGIEQPVVHHIIKGRVGCAERTGLRHEDDPAVAIGHHCVGSRDGRTEGIAIDGLVEGANCGEGNDPCSDWSSFGVIAS